MILWVFSWIHHTGCIYHIKALKKQTSGRLDDLANCENTVSPYLGGRQKLGSSLHHMQLQRVTEAFTLWKHLALVPVLVIETASCQTILCTGAKAVSHPQLPENFQGIYMLEYKMLFLFSDRLLHIQNPFKDKATTGNYSQQSEWQGNTQLFAKALQNFCCCCFCSCFWFSHCQRLSATLLTALSRTLAVQQHSHSPASFMQQFPAQSHITDVTRLLCSLLPNANEMGVRWQGCSVSLLGT